MPRFPQCRFRPSTVALLAGWSLLAALPACNFTGRTARADSPAAARSSTRPAAEPGFRVDAKATLEYLASEELEGRATGSPGIDKAADRIADTFAKLGLRPAPGLDGYFQPFTMTASVKLDPKSSLAAGKGWNWVDDVTLDMGKTYQPLSWSSEGEFKGPVVFAGYGVTNKDKNYDDYAGIDVKGKVVLAMRFEPRDADGKSRFTGQKDDWSPHAAILQKAKAAAEHGAVALLLVTPPAQEEGADALMPFARMFQFERGPIPTIQVSRGVADAILKAGGAAGDIKALQATIDGGGKPASAELKDVGVKGNVAFRRDEKSVRNVVAALPGSGPKADEYVVIGAHYDHLGRGGPGSLAPLSKEIHHGADDNASGTTAMLKIAEHFAQAARDGRPPARTLVFAAFTGEELGLIGSSHFVNHPPVPLKNVAAMLNLDMVGRVRDGKLSIGGTGTAPSFERIIKDAAEGSSLKVSSMGKGGLGPSDHTSFATKKVPVLFFFSGLHTDYHRPSDVASKVNYEGLDQVAEFGAKIVESMAKMPKEEYVGTFDGSGGMHSGTGTGSGGGGVKVTLGVVPDYSDETVKGVRISGTSPGSPADKAGLRGGDTLIRYNDTKLDNLMDLFQALGKGKPGDKVRIKLLRDGKEVDTEAVLAERKG